MSDYSYETRLREMFDHKSGRKEPTEEKYFHRFPKLRCHRQNQGERNCERKRVGNTVLIYLTPKKRGVNQGPTEYA